MDYAILFYEPTEQFASREHHDTSGAYWGAWMEYIGALQKSGLVKSGLGLQGPAKGTTVRIVDGKRHVQDGPFADTKEQLGGFFILDAPDLETVLEWAARSPAAAYGGVEVRPALPPMPAPR